MADLGFPKHGGLSTFVWCPRASQQLEASTPHIYNDWPSLYEVFKKTPGPKEILLSPSDFTEEDASIFVIPPGEYDMKGLYKIKSIDASYWIPPVLLFDNATFSGIISVDFDGEAGFFQVLNANSTEAPFKPGRGTPADYGGFMVFTSHRTFFRNVNSAPLFDVEEDGFLSLRTWGGGFNADSGDGEPPICNTPTSAFSLVLWYNQGNGFLEGDNILSGDTLFIWTPLELPHHRAGAADREGSTKINNFADQPNFSGGIFADAPAAGGVRYAVDGFSDDTTTETAIYNDVHLCDASTAGVTVVLPTAYLHDGMIIGVKENKGGANGITVNTTNSETIDGSGSDSVAGAYGYKEYVSDGYNWLIK